MKREERAFAEREREKKEKKGKKKVKKLVKGAFYKRQHDAFQRARSARFYSVRPTQAQYLSTLSDVVQSEPSDSHTLISVKVDQSFDFNFSYF